MGVSQASLGFVGESAPAVITYIRREGGERTEGKPGRYTYNAMSVTHLPYPMGKRLTDLQRRSEIRSI